MIETRQARYFAAVAEELHFGRAAERLRMSQPPLSQAIRQLERAVGARLLERSNRMVTLTEPGRVFLQHCYTLLAAAERAGAAAAQAESGQVGRLRFAAVTSAFADPLPAVLAAFRVAHPRIELRVEEIDTRSGVEALLAHRIDVALIRHDRTDGRLRSEPLLRDHFVVAVPVDHPWSGSGPVDLAALRDESWIWIPRSISPSYHDELVAACRGAGFSPDARHWATSIHSQLEMVACGLGITLAPSRAAARRNDVAALVPERPIPLLDLSLVYRTGTEQVLVDTFRRACASVAQRVRDDTHGLSP